MATQSAAQRLPLLHASPGILPVAVFGSDDREPVPERYEGVAQSIGVLFNNRTRTVCTAFCVADTVVATAAHCLASPVSNPGASANYVFARGHDRVRDTVRAEGFSTRSSAQNAMTGNFQLRVRPPIDAAYDWGLLRLSRPVCAKRELPIHVLSPTELMDEATAGRVFQISYHRDYTQWQPAYSKPCSIARDFDGVTWSTIAPDFLEADRMILHTCDTGGASSGSPMLIDTPKGPAVVGINVGTYERSKVVMQNGRMTHRQRAETVANTAVNAAAFIDEIEVLHGAQILASGPPMKTLQEHLRRLGYYRGKVDGGYGPGLRTAIRAYETAQALPVRGLATQSLLLRLESNKSVALQTQEARSRRKR
jgi:protease YdgD